MKWGEIMIKKLFSNKNATVLILGAVAGILLILFGSLGGSEKNKNAQVQQNDYTSQELESYTENLEKKIEKHIEKIGGVSNVSVIVTIEGTKETVYATEGVNKDYVTVKDSEGNESAIRLMEINANIRGIAIVCDYGNDETIKQEMIRMLSSLFGIGTNRISVLQA